MHGIVPIGLLPLGFLVLDAFLTFAAWKSSEKGSVVSNLHAYSYRTAIVSCRTLAVGFPLPTISQSYLFTLFCTLILDHGVKQFRYGLELLRLSYSQFVQSSKMIKWDLRPVPFRIEFLNIIMSKNNCKSVRDIFDRIVGPSDPRRNGLVFGLVPPD